jgi:hypothetical protein
MPATMARQERWVQLKQSNMRLALNMPNVASQAFSRTAIGETQQLTKKPCNYMQEEKNKVVVSPGRNKVKDTTDRNLEIVRKNQTDGCLPCQIDTANNA